MEDIKTHFETRISVGAFDISGSAKFDKHDENISKKISFTGKIKILGINKPAKVVTNINDIITYINEMNEKYENTKEDQFSPIAFALGKTNEKSKLFLKSSLEIEVFKK